MSDVVETKLAILGTGPAGLTAAVYAARANLEPIVIQGPEPGGQLMITTDVENFPGFEDGIMGPELMDRMTQQAERFGSKMVFGQVEKIDLSASPKRLWVDDGSEIHAHSVIISTGASARWLGLESEQRLRGHGVSACATCDGFFFADKKISVVGGGDSAMEEATFLTKFADEVTIIHRRDEFRASKIMQDRALANPKIKVAWNRVVVDVLGEKETGVRGLILEDTETGEREEVESEGLFLAIGHTPNTSIFEGQLKMDEQGYLVVSQPGTTRTEIPGVFAAGDVTDKVYRQAVTAAGLGCMAALDAERWLTAEGLDE